MQPGATFDILQAVRTYVDKNSFYLKINLVFTSLLLFRNIPLIKMKNSCGNFVFVYLNILQICLDLVFLV